MKHWAYRYTWSIVAWIAALTIPSMGHSITRPAWSCDLDLLGIRRANIEWDLNDVLIVIVNVYGWDLLFLCCYLKIGVELSCLLIGTHIYFLRESCRGYTWGLYHLLLGLTKLLTQDLMLLLLLQSDNVRFGYVLELRCNLREIDDLVSLVGWRLNANNGSGGLSGGLLIFAWSYVGELADRDHFLLLSTTWLKYVERTCACWTWVTAVLRWSNILREDVLRLDNEHVWLICWSCAPWRMKAVNTCWNSTHLVCDDVWRCYNYILFVDTSCHCRRTGLLNLLHDLDQVLLRQVAWSAWAGVRSGCLLWDIQWSYSTCNSLLKLLRGRWKIDAIVVLFHRWIELGWC